MQLSDHFTLAELTRSGLAVRRNIDNTPSTSEIARLKLVATKILEPVRAHFGVPFSPSSGYRSLTLNRALGSKDNSQHVRGEAVDIRVPGISTYDLALWMYKNLSFDQLILENYVPGDVDSGWVHCSYVAQDARGQVLTFAGNLYQDGLIA